MITAVPEKTTDVLIVGAGPTGLMAALVLAHAGVRAEIIDPKPGPTRESRALGVQARSMELYAQLGLVDQVVAGSTTAAALQLGWQDRPGRRVELTFLQQRVSDYPGLHVFEQSRNETLLYEALRARDREVRWGDRLVDLTVESDGVRVLTDHDGELSRVNARWCIGADGATSMVRRQLDVPFDGVTDPGRFWVADVRQVRGLPDDVINLRFGTDDLLLSFPLGPGGHHRLLGVVGDAEPTAESVLPGVTTTYGISYGEIDWFAHYRVHHRVAARFRQGPVFLAGDAAHVHSPVGGQGMNTGLQDAHNLALAIADVVAGRTDPSGDELRLDRYQTERRPVARHLVDLTDRAFTLMSGRGGVRGVIRRQFATGLAPLVATVVPRLPARSRFGGYLGQTRIRYPMPSSDDPVVGRRLPPAGDNHALLADFGWQLHRYGGTRQAGRDSADGIPGWLGEPHQLPADPTGRLQPDRTYLVRPDGFVAASAAIGDGSAIATALAQHGLR
ncbi:FAD-dependent oxidoreductase [Microlunatus soli]|uniref:2-polyprenyl-6-methoxyphenol hydroxylase n=1 Tax=Microlunatus soli TaxID=630515 RepID=A0A1H1YRS6_9ACTN|nr:FAD-dependent monooxygenase [Microlunatus soli]SDT24158.1 2-polyprenyl-6-methoxyphenol hydroxylase [Microlunatus soli]